MKVVSMKVKRKKKQKLELPPGYSIREVAESPSCYYVADEDDTYLILSKEVNHWWQDGVVEKRYVGHYPTSKALEVVEQQLIERAIRDSK